MDDWLLHTKTFLQPMKVVGKFFGLYDEWNFTFNPAKGNLLTQNPKWCRRIVTAEGITLNPRRIDGLLSMQKAETDGVLQQFIFAINWMRKGNPDYNKNISPLQSLLIR